jgi:hypothetical protein
MKDKFYLIFQRSPPELAKLASQARDLIREVAPEAFEIAWVSSKRVGYGVMPPNRKKIPPLPPVYFCELSPREGYIELSLDEGPRLPDPERLLAPREGDEAGERRCVRLMWRDDAARPALRRLLAAAFRRLKQRQ